MPTLAEGLDAARRAIARQGWQITHTASDFVIAYVPPAKRLMPEPSIVEVADLVVTVQSLFDGTALERYHGFVAWKRRGHPEGRRVFSVYFPIGTTPSQQRLFSEATTHVTYPQLPPAGSWPCLADPTMPKIDVVVPKSRRSRSRGGMLGCPPAATSSGRQGARARSAQHSSGWGGCR